MQFQQCETRAKHVWHIFHKRVTHSVRHTTDTQRVTHSMGHKFASRVARV